MKTNEDIFCRICILRLSYLFFKIIIIQSFFFFHILDIQEKIIRNLNNLVLDNTIYCWPKDTFFRYLQAMEALQENLFERQTIIDMISTLP